MRRTHVLLALAVALAAPPTAALYIMTPLVLSADEAHADVGDAVDFDVAPQPEEPNATRDWGGRTVVAKYAWDPEEGTERSEVDKATWETRTLGDVILDAGAEGSFTWTVPEEVDDKNVVVTLESEDGKELARFDLGVGDAEPLYRLAAETGGPVDAPGEEPTDGAPVEETRGDDTRDTPAPGLLAALAAVGAGLVLRRKA